MAICKGIWSFLFFVVLKKHNTIGYLPSKALIKQELILVFS